MFDITSSIVTYKTNKEELKKILNSFLNTKLKVKVWISDNSPNNDLEVEILNLNDERIEYPFKKVIEKQDYLYEMRDLGYEKIREVPLLSGCFMFLRTEIFVKVNGFDERFFMYMEDFDLCRRIGEISKIIFYPEVEIFHNHAKESFKNKKMMWEHIKSAIKYFNKWGWI